MKQDLLTMREIQRCIFEMYQTEHGGPKKTEGKKLNAVLTFKEIPLTVQGVS